MELLLFANTNGEIEVSSKLSGLGPEKAKTTSGKGMVLQAK